jgi:diguanylate cyclase (GGDEF)-like protein
MALLGFPSRLNKKPLQGLSVSFLPITDSQTAKPVPLELTKALLMKSAKSSRHILNGVSIESVWGILEHCPLRELSPSYCLLEKHQQSQALYIVLTGKLKAYLTEEQDQEIAQFETGQTVGELAVIDGATASARVVAAETSTVLEIDEATYWRLIQSSHEFCSNMMALLAARLRSNNYSLGEYNRLQQKYQRESMVDALTGLYNRRWLDSKLRSLVLRTKRERHPLSVIMLDIDHFKRFNDNYGHRAGDCVIQAVAKTFSNNVRPLDFSARYGGEEFCILLPYTNAAGAKIAAERIRKLVASGTVLDEGLELPKVTISAGAASLQPDEDATKLLGRADQALYRAKQAGRNRVETA